MTIVNYREIQDRFTHIDAEFVSSTLRLPEGDGSFTVRFYPWWEHPLYLKARDEGTRWGFQGSREGEIVVTVFPKGLREFRLSSLGPTGLITDWAFLEAHPLLWPYQCSWPVEITCNSRLSIEEVLGLVDLVRQEAWESPFEYFNTESGFKTFVEWANQGSLSLGRFPSPLYEMIITYLDTIHAEYYSPSPPTINALSPKLLLLEGNDYLIADDFDLDVPPIAHKEEWFHI